MDPVVRVSPTAGVSRLHSLRTKITLLVGALLVIVVSALAVDSYMQVRSLAVSRASSRLQSVARQFASSSAETTRRRLEALGAIANGASVTRFVSAPAPATRAAAERELRALLADTTTIRIRVRSAGNQFLLDLGDTSQLNDLHAAGPLPAGSLTTIGPPVPRGDSVVFVSSAAVLREGRTIGRLNVWRRAVLSPALKTQMSQFIGSDANMYFGGGTPPTWVDLSGTVVPAPDSSFVAGEPFIHQHEGEDHMAVVENILGTPWQIAVEFPMRTVLAQPRSFLRRLIIALVVLLLVGGGLTWWMSGRVTAPLRRLTASAESLAAGVYNVHDLVDDGSRDEIGRLARAFYVMGLRVQDTHAQLQGELTERTDEMRATFKTLEKTLDDLARKEKGV